MLQLVINKWNSYFKRLEPKWDIRFAKNDIDSNTADNTAFIYPDGSESFTEPGNIGRNPSQLRTRGASLRVDLYSTNLESIDQAINSSVYAMDLSVLSPNISGISGEWVYEGEELEKGFKYTLYFIIDVVVHRAHLEEVTITSTEQTKQFVPGSIPNP